MAAAPVAPEPRAEPARGAVGALRPAEARSGWVRNRDAAPDPLVLEVYGWLNWATSGYMTNRPFDAVLLWRDRGNREVPAGVWVAREDQERVFRNMIRAGWPDREPGWPARLEELADLRVTGAEAHVWLPRALRADPIHWRYCPRNPPPPQPQPPEKRRRR